MKKPTPTQTAIGNNIVQAAYGSTAAIINLTQKNPLRYLLAVPPSPPDRFTGRIQLLKEIKTHIFDTSPVSTVALTGMGGMGKTATAKKIASELTNDFPGGIFWASLSETNGDGLPIFHAWALICAYEIAEDVNIETLSSIIRGLFSQRIKEKGAILIVIDDIRKEWINTAITLTKSLPENVPVLLTTRDEHLALELNAKVFRLDALSLDDALLLLEKFIGLVRPAERGEADKLLDSVGYLPLAVEIAGKKLARLLDKPGYTIGVFRQKIDSKSSNALSLLDNSVVARSFASTYDGLDKFTQFVFRRLGCFASGLIFLDDMLGIMKKHIKVSRKRLEKTLDDLEQFSLVNWGGIENSYTLHPLLHHFAQELLNKGGELQNAAISHSQYFCNAFSGSTSEVESSFPFIESRLPNLLLAADNAYKEKLYSDFINLSTLLGRTDGYLYLRGYWDQAVRLLERGNDIALKTGNENIAKLLMWHIATINREKGRYKEAKKIFLDLIIKEEMIGKNTVDLARNLFGLGYVHLFLSEYEDAEQILRKSANVARQVGDDYSLGEALRGLGRVYLSKNNITDASKLFNESIPVLETSKNIQGLIYALRGLGETLTLQQEYQKSQELLSKALGLAEQSQDKQALGYTLRALGNLYSSQQEYNKAKEVFMRCMDISKSIGEMGSLAATQSLLADVLYLLEDYPAAENVFEESKQLTSSLGLKRWGARADFGLAKIYYKQGIIDKALLYAEQSFKILEDLKHRDKEEVQLWLQSHYPKSN